MEIYGILDIFPLWGLFLITVVVVLLSVEGGYWSARYHQQRSQEVNAVPVGAMVGAILGLLAFMLAFTFGFAATRFEERKQVLLAETGAIRTTYLRAALMPEPITTETRDILREYIDVRLKGTQTEKIDEAISASQELTDRLWLQAVAAAEKGKPPLNSLFITSVNEVIDLNSKRITVGLRNRVPGTIWIALYLLIILAMSTIGYQGGLSSTKRPIAVLTLIFAFSSVIILIVDLDRPGKGLLEISQQSMLDLRKYVSVTSQKQQTSNH